jgi:nucleoid DNA-binding protein
MKKQLQAELVERIAEETGLFDYQVVRVLQSMTWNIVESLKEGRPVQIRELGTFYLRKYTHQTSWDPHRGQPKPVSDRLIPKFKWVRTSVLSIRKEIDPSCKRSRNGKGRSRVSFRK